MNSLLKIELRRDHDAVAARQTARYLARRLGFEHQDQIRIATATSELVRAALTDDEALAEFGVETGGARPRLVISVSGPSLLRQRAGKRAANGDGATAARRLLDTYDPPGRPDTVALTRVLPRGELSPERVRELRAELAQLGAGSDAGYDAELHRQNLELSATLFELEKKQRELTRLNSELADTNRGVMALYAELDERANQLRQTDELKTKFFSNMSHELRTPLNSILALSKLLLAHTDGPLNAEQANQVHLIHDAAEELYELVSDLLDLAKVEAGKSKLAIGRFSVANLFGALRGMIRPLLPDGSVSLELDVPGDRFDLIGDEAKVGQVLRNFLSNAVKFTERGSIKVTAAGVDAGEPPVPGQAPAEQESILFCVADTGIGISPGDREIIFDEFTQVRNALQRRVRGTGLGLPLCRSIAELLGGRIWVESELGAGSRFYFLVPRFYRPGLGASNRADPLQVGASGRGGSSRPSNNGSEAESDRLAVDAELGRILLVDDDEKCRSVLTSLVRPYCGTAVPVADPELALEMVRADEADCLILDLLMPELDGLTFLARTREDPSTRSLPILVCSSKVLSGEERSLLRDLGAAFLPKDSLDSASLAHGIIEALVLAPKDRGRSERRPLG
ncbi:MAG TPA: ATP-binding protein [Gammaproteobacteria bacterium]|nr:ATP-binding protein [Gammaproteobacteria bacterium]